MAAIAESRSGPLLTVGGRILEFQQSSCIQRRWPAPDSVDRKFAAGHSHEQAVSSFCLETERPVDLERFRRWLSREMQLNGANIYRMKGFLNFKGYDERVVVQGVHMLVDNTSLGSWGSRPRRTQLVFIGKNLDRGQMMLGFENCLC